MTNKLKNPNIRHRHVTNPILKEVPIVTCHVSIRNDPTLEDFNRNQRSDCSATSPIHIQFPPANSS